MLERGWGFDGVFVLCAVASAAALLIYTLIYFHIPSPTNCRSTVERDTSIMTRWVHKRFFRYLRVSPLVPS